MVAEGLSSRKIAAVLQISVKTVDFHRANIMERLNVHSVADLTRYMMQTGKVAEPKRQ